MSINSQYGLAFRRSVFLSQDLLKPAVRQKLKSKEMVWIRKDETHYPFPYICRNPILGCRVEVFARFAPGCVHIDSPEAWKIIKRLCY